jgi:hypothetical protein
VGRARWRESAGWRTVRGMPLAAGAAHIAGHALASPTRSSGSARSYLPQPTFPRAYKPVLAVPRACLPAQAAAVRHCHRSVSIVLRSISSRTSEPQPFPVHYNTSPEPCVDHAEPPLRRSPSLRGCR